jgi:hypothetical protein
MHEFRFALPQHTIKHEIEFNVEKGDLGELGHIVQGRKMKDVDGVCLV